MVKYKFAYDSQQNIIDIETVTKENKSDIFLCLGCGREMTPVLSPANKRAKHFRHKVEIECSKETYLHNLIKTKVRETYQNCVNSGIPFNIKILTHPVCDFYENDFLATCKLEPEKQEFDLTKWFQNIYLERKENCFIPDILLESNTREKIFFEVLVTHASSQEKINSQYRIIEFTANLDDHEESLQKIESCLLEESETIQFFNFNTTRKAQWCKGNCFKGIEPYAKETLYYNIFIVYVNGTSQLVEQTLEDLNLLLPKILYFEYIPLKKGISMTSIYRNKVVESYKNGLSIKNCFLCKHHSIRHLRDASGMVFCTLKYNIESPNIAINCAFFYPNPLVFSEYISHPPKNPSTQKNIMDIQEDEEGWF